MPFATSNVQASKFGNLSVTYGDWSGTVGDAQGSFGVAGGRVYLYQFSIQDTDSPTGRVAHVSPSTSGSVTTLTVSYSETVTTGRFIVIHS